MQSLQQLPAQVAALDTRVASLELHFLQFRAEVKEEFLTTRRELGGEINGLREELGAVAEGLREEIATEGRNTRSEMRALFEEAIARNKTIREG
ncbi:MAG: hypothetical protein A3G76_03680 [Acidobacteria bacterium RIFCSPLOWO2_12_FULL_65_11]|nr:MAG: hypothetical protein A3H95_07355 [Acidobacteria bacterium RIFCSPLOWO2_02_FULL_64_15]OFW30028.1 MAG: hypothetical protein A3G76_03680 [Acidobacteria bacterium RIFCSPLOWO2_12_FULL_65_11]